MQQVTDDNGKIRRVILLSGFLLTLVCCAIYLVHPAFIASACNRSTDSVMSLAYRSHPSPAVVIVDIDDKSLSLYGQWPWPRDRMAQLLTALKNSGAATVGLDLILSEKDRTSQKNARKGTTPRPPSTDTLKESEDRDLALARTLAQGPFVLGHEFSFGNRSGRSEPGALHPPGVVWISKPGGANGRASFFAASGVIASHAPFSKAVQRSGFLNATADSDGIVRRVPMLIRYEDNLYPSLALAIIMRYQDNSQIHIIRRNAEIDLVVGDRSIPVDEQGNLVPQFSRHHDAPPRISAADLLQGKVPRERLRDRMIIVGASAAGLEPGYQTPADTLLSHSDLQAQVLNTLVTGSWAIRTGTCILWEVVAGMLLAAAMIVVTIRAGALAGAVAALTLMAGVWGGAVVILHSRIFLLAPLFPCALVLLNYAVLSLVKSCLAQAAAQKAADSTLVLLKSSEKNLDAIIKAVPDIIFRLDSAGRITFMSPAVARYTDRSAALLGRQIFDLVLPDDLPKAQHRLNEKRTGERATRGLELRLLLPQHRGGESEPGFFSISAEGIYCSDRPCPENFLGTQGIMRDITEQKKLEETLLQAQKMEAIGRLAAGVAHDLNNILVGLVAYPDLLLLELPPDSPLREKISLIQKSGKKAAAIVQDLLTLGRRGVRISEIVDLNDVVCDYLTSPEFDAVLKGHPHMALKKVLAADLFNIKGSKVHLSKAVMNIVHNAAEAMPAGGRITISSYNSYLESPLNGYEEIPPGEYACICVADEGVGISHEDLQRIFEPFFSKKSMQQSGSGLGMTIVWTTIKDHDGYLDLQSSEGDGTRIILYLPATREQEKQCQHFVLEKYLGDERILVVDDMPDQLHIAATMLAKLGYKVSSAASGEAALGYLCSHSVDLVVLDMIMPEMDGLETYRQLLTIRPGQRAIITSGFSDSVKVAALQSLGAGAYVQKPYTLEKLGIAVRRELDRPQEMPGQLAPTGPGAC